MGLMGYFGWSYGIIWGLNLAQVIEVWPFGRLDPQNGQFHRQSNVAFWMLFPATKLHFLDLG